MLEKKLENENCLLIIDDSYEPFLERRINKKDYYDLEDPESSYLREYYFADLKYKKYRYFENELGFFVEFTQKSNFHGDNWYYSRHDTLEDMKKFLNAITVYGKLEKKFLTKEKKLV